MTRRGLNPDEIAYYRVRWLRKNRKHGMKRRTWERSTYTHYPGTRLTHLRECGYTYKLIGVLKFSLDGGDTEIVLETGGK